MSDDPNFPFGQQPGVHDPYGLPPAEYPPVSPPPVPSWENRETLGFFKAWFGTIGEVLARPDDTFSRMNPEGGIGNPLGFYILTIWTTQIIGFGLWLPIRILLIGLRPSAAAQATELPKWLVGGFSLGFQFVLILLVLPLTAAAGSFIASGIAHLLLMLVGGARRSFETTYRALTYATGGTCVLAMIPFCGGLIMVVAQVVVGAIALSRAHQTESWRAILALLIPYVLFTLCCCGLLFVLIGGLMSSPEFQKSLQDLSKQMDIPQ